MNKIKNIIMTIGAILVICAIVPLVLYVDFNYNIGKERGFMAFILGSLGSIIFASGTIIDDK
jgi:hypothetical protein